MEVKKEIPESALDYRTWRMLHPCHGGCGVYVVCVPSGDPLYIGSTLNMQSRLRAHERQTGFSLGRHVIYWYPVLAPIEAKAFEYWLIRKFNPPLNKHGRGRRARVIADWFYDDRVIHGAN